MNYGWRVRLVQWLLPKCGFRCVSVVSLYVGDSTEVGGIVCAATPADMTLVCLGTIESLRLENPAAVEAVIGEAVMGSDTAVVH